MRVSKGSVTYWTTVLSLRYGGYSYAMWWQYAAQLLSNFFSMRHSDACSLVEWILLHGTLSNLPGRTWSNMWVGFMIVHLSMHQPPPFGMSFGILNLSVHWPNSFEKKKRWIIWSETRAVSGLRPCHKAQYTCFSNSKQNCCELSTKSPLWHKLDLTVQHTICQSVQLRVHMFLPAMGQNGSKNDICEAFQYWTSLLEVGNNRTYDRLPSWSARAGCGRGKTKDYCHVCCVLFGLPKSYHVFDFRYKSQPTKRTRLQHNCSSPLIQDSPQRSKRWNSLLSHWSPSL